MACRSSTSHRDGDAGPYRRGRSRKPALSGPGSAGTPPRLVQSVSAMARCRCRHWMALMVGLARPMYGVPIFGRRLDQARSLRQVSPVVALSFLLRLVRSALDLLGVHRLSGLENTSRSSCSATRSKSPDSKTWYVRRVNDSYASSAITFPSPPFPSVLGPVMAHCWP